MPVTVDLIEAPLVDSFRRSITYLRISVTDKCNLRCVYCMPEAGLTWLHRDELLTYEEIARICQAGARMGIRSVRITGGEPLVRRDLSRLVEMLAAIPGIDDIALSTNGLLLAAQAAELKRAGLQRVNISLDTLQPDRFEAIARRPGLDAVLAGIDAAIEADLAPVKINCVVMRGRNDDEIGDFAQLTRSKELYVRFIEMMPVHENVEQQAAEYLSADDILARVREEGAVVPVTPSHGNGPARYVAFEGARGAVGVISPLSHDYCERCNRVRLSADGRLKLCLFGDQHVDLRTPLRNGASLEQLGDILQDAMFIKPERHHLRLGETSSRMRAFSEIGG